MDTQRLILLFIFGFSVLMLWEAWDREHRPKPPPAPAAVQSVPGVPAPAVPGKAAGPPAAPSSAVPSAATQEARGETIRLTTDLVIAEVDTLGGTLKRLELLRHKDSTDPNNNFVLIGPAHHYEAQSGLTREGGPNHRTLWQAKPGPRTLAAGVDTLELRLTAPGPDGLDVEKIYRLHRNSYLIDVAMELRNRGSAPVSTYAYFQLTHDGKPEGNRNSVAETFGAQSFTGFAVYGGEHKFQKVAPSDLDKGKGDYVKEAKVGWLSFIQHYFVSAWLAINAWPLFWLLEKLHGLTGNWGVAIILLTVLIKLIFFPLSAASYRSMAKMKLITPRLTKIREMYANDRQKMNQAMMELYKTEKINPLGGCFPIVVQIPVFIALYWVLLAAIELRHAPFMLWIHDLAALDPY